MKTVAVKDEGGNVCTTSEAQQQRWRRHFTKILNIQSEFDVEELGRVKQRPDMAERVDVCIGKAEEWQGWW